MNVEEEQEFTMPHCIGCSDDPVAELKEWHEKAEAELHGEQVAPGDVPTSQTTSMPASELTSHRELMASDTANSASNVVAIENAPTEVSDGEVFSPPAYTRRSPNEEKKKLVTMGLSTAMAIALHNFPEGLATFVAALDDPAVGATLAIAIGIHNIPEGLCVALPVYYATGNRWKAFAWGSLSGITEPIAALLGWLVLAGAMKDDVFGILFGLVSGMMVMIALKELIPTAHRYDPDDTVVTYSIIAGMGIIALSLVLFKI